MNGAGATFPAAIYQKWFEEFKGRKDQLSVFGLGCGYPAVDRRDRGLWRLRYAHDGRADVAAMKVKPLHFPTVLGAVVPVYNIPGVAGI